MPNRALSDSTISGVVANPVATDVKLQMMTLHCATDAKGNRSPTMPPRGEPNEYTQRNMDPVRPSWEFENPRSLFRIGNIE